MRSEALLKAMPDVELRWREPLSKHTTFRVGGPVRCLARPRTEEALSGLIRALREEQVRFVVLGGGSNVLPPDGEWDIVVIQLGLASHSLFRCREQGAEADCIYAGAGIRLSKLVRYCVENDLEGIESLAGIPGTVGGALVMNAGTPSGAISDALLRIELIDAGGNRRRVLKEELSPTYRSMGLPGGSIVLGGCFGLKKSSKAVLEERVHGILERRRRTQPLRFPSAGSIFKNPPGAFAGELIEKAGLKGFRLGGAEVSRKHANWIINRGNANSGEIMGLIEKIENEVFGTFGVRLEREIRILAQS